MKHRSSSSFRHCKEEEEEEAATINLLRSINNLMTARGGYGSFERVSLKGDNVGAAMTVRHGNSGENCCNINIYVNNNVQGVTNSVLVGSEVRIVDSGVSLSMRDVMQLGKGAVEKNRRRRVSDWGFVGLCLAFVVVVFLVLSVF